MSEQLGFAALLHEQLEDLYEHAPCGYLSTEPGGLILKVNQTFCELTGYTSEQLVGRRRLPDLLTIGGRIYYETHLRPLLGIERRVREIALDLQCADNRQLPVLVNAVERRANDSPAAPAIVRFTVFDATERRQYERELLRAREQAEAAAQSRNDLIAMISHDLRAPLSAIVTAATMLQTTELTPQQQRYVRVLQSSGSDAMTLLNSTLSLSALEAGRATVNSKEFAVRDLVEHALSPAKLAAAAKPDLRVELTVDERTPPRVIGDPDRLLQVLMNLTGNAVKFTERGVVSLTAYPAHVADRVATLAFVVSDTGIGIPADRLPHIFDEFTQASPEIGRRYGGTGLGLAISRKLLRLLGSDLRVSSTVGEGTTFSFEVECTLADAAE